MPIRLLLALCAGFACGGAARGQSFSNQHTRSKFRHLRYKGSGDAVQAVVAESLKQGKLRAPAGTPPGIVTVLQEAIAYVVESPETRQALEAISVNPRLTAPRTFTDIIARDTARWKRVAATANVKLD
jgi:hypothetical protein